MRKITYLAVAFIACTVLNADYLYPWFTLFFLAMLMFRIPESAWWEIPLAVLFCSVVKEGFGDDVTVIMRVIIAISSVLIAYHSPYKLAIFFPIAIGAVFFDNIYAFAAVWAMLWYGVRAFFVKQTVLTKYSTTK